MTKDRVDIGELLPSVRSVAVLGASDRAGRPAHFVPDYLHRAGIEVLPVNPRLEGETLWGKAVRATLAELRRSVDVVDVFRRSEVLHEHLEDILAMRPAPRVVWLQSGIRNDDFAARLQEKGIEVVQSRCLMIDHRAAERRG